MKTRSVISILGAFLSITVMGSIANSQVPLGSSKFYDLIPGYAAPDELTSPVEAGMTVAVVDVARVSRAGKHRPRMNLVRSYPGMADWLVVNDMRGQLFLVTDPVRDPVVLLDLAAAVGENFKIGNLEIGLKSFTFHPDFDRPGAAGENLVYTVHSEQATNQYQSSNAPYFGLEGGNAHHLSVISEWKVAREGVPRVLPDSQRIVLVLEQPEYDHTLYYIDFNPAAKMQGSDYGMLYIGVGNGGRRSQLELDDRSLFGKVLRINPLSNQGESYQIPADNPYVKSDAFRSEVWSLGFRNPQHFSWDYRTGDMFGIDIGHEHIEEVNIIKPGKHYGWSYFEGRYLFDRENPAELKKPLLPAGMIPAQFPVAEYDHRFGRAIAGGHVYFGSELPDLVGNYVFADITSGRLFYFDTRNISGSSPAKLYELQLSRHGVQTDMTEILGKTRVDLRLGVDARGELLLVNKRDSVIRKLVAEKTSRTPTISQ